MQKNKTDTRRLSMMDEMIEKGVVDAIITDLPYGTTTCKRILYI